MSNPNNINQSTYPFNTSFTMTKLNQMKLTDIINDINLNASMSYSHIRCLNVVNSKGGQLVQGTLCIN